jgi:hypothetical protein
MTEPVAHATRICSNRCTDCKTHMQVARYPREPTPGCGRGRAGRAIGFTGTSSACCSGWTPHGESALRVLCYIARASYLVSHIGVVHSRTSPATVSRSTAETIDDGFDAPDSSTYYVLFRRACFEATCTDLPHFLPLWSTRAATSCLCWRKPTIASRINQWTAHSRANQFFPLAVNDLAVVIHERSTRALSAPSIGAVGRMRIHPDSQESLAVTEVTMS